MSTTENAVLKAKDNLPEVTPTPPAMQKPKTSPQALKERLEWGEPAFTILDVRDRNSFNQCRIMGAISMPLNEEEVVNRTLKSLQQQREIYVYGDSDEQSSQGASRVREAGFTEVSEISGGITAWKSLGAPTEGTEERGEKVAGNGAYNVANRLEENEKVQRKF